MSDQFVYFIQADEGGPIKIGFTADDPQRRLNQLQTGNASALKLLGAIKGTTARERKFHADLAEWRLQGEWFESHPTVLAAIQSALVEDPPKSSSTSMHCSFCFAHQDDVKIFVVGPAAHICDACSDEVSEIVAEARAAGVPVHR